MFCITYIGSRRTQLLTYGTRGFGTCLAIRRFHYWIYGRDFKLITDHKPLLWLFSPDKHIAPYASGRIQRWSLLFQSYTFRLLHTSGKLLVVVADTILVPGEWVCLVEKLESGCVTAETIASETSKGTDTVKRNYVRFFTCRIRKRRNAMPLPFELWVYLFLRSRGKT